jgi:hypothetical protein
VATQRSALVAQIEQQAVEVVADVLLGHRERGAFDQLLQTGLADFHPFGRVDLVERREIVGRQAGQGEPAASGLDGDLVAGLAHRDLAAVGQRADDLEQLARRNGGLAGDRILDPGPGDHLDFEIGAGEREQIAFDAGEQIGQDRQGLPAFDHVDDLSERLQEDFALQTETHVVRFPS